MRNTNCTRGNMWDMPHESNCMEFQREITNEYVKHKRWNKSVVRNTEGDSAAREWSYFSSYRPTRVARSNKDLALLLLVLLDSFCVLQAGRGKCGAVDGWEWAMCVGRRGKSKQSLMYSKLFKISTLPLQLCHYDTLLRIITAFFIQWQREEKSTWYVLRDFTHIVFILKYF